MVYINNWYSEAVGMIYGIYNINMKKNISTEQKTIVLLSKNGTLEFF